MQAAGEFWVRKHTESADRGQCWPYNGYPVFRYPVYRGSSCPQPNTVYKFPTTAAIPLHLNTFVVVKETGNNPDPGDSLP